jgi:hypothetical protein
MNNAMSLFDQPNPQLPAYLGAFNSALGTDLALGGFSGNRIGLKGSRFRLIVNGQEEAILETFNLDVIIVGAAPGVARIFFEGNYDPDGATKAHPVCYSSDGVTPGADVTNPQSLRCATCPQNEKGSKISDNGVKTKACNYFKRMMVTLVDDPEHRLFKLDGKAMTIFGEGVPAQNKFTLNEYAKKFSTRGLDPAHFVTRLSFDPDSSVPKLYFSPLRVITEDEAPWVMDLVNSEDVKAGVMITAITDASDAEQEAPGATVPASSAPAPTKAPQAAPAAPTAAPRPGLAPKIVTTGKPAVAPAAAAPQIVKTAPLAAVKTTPPAAQAVPQQAVAEVTNADVEADLADFLRDLEGQG